ncbi:MAG TPA: ribosome biogenesis GTPase Der [Acetivibrio sp.]|nr:ribosome biogenesis GTPase Der [Acetivibrio sp.]
MSKPIVAIVGRPNVGKSTFFNYLAGKRISIVEDTPGVTRDRIYTEVEWRNRKFTLIDTGGIEPYSEDKIMKQMKNQAEIAIETADVIIFMVDMKDGLTASDREVATMLRKSKKPIILAVNKVDKVGELPAEVYEFYNLGMDNLMPISSIHGLGVGDLLDEVFKYFPDEAEEEYDEEVIKVAVVGKPNAGKSSLINKILGEERVIVSDIPGTTRDAIDTYVENEEGKFVFIDTAGIRRKSKITENIERYSAIRSWTAIERADVCLIMIDAVEGVTEQDTKIAGYAHEQGKASIIVVNKWDLVEKTTGTLEEYRKTVLEKLGFMLYAPVVFISAKTGQRVDKIYDLVKYVANQAALRITTGVLNDLLNEAIAMVQPPSDKGRRLKIYYMTQASVKPPTFVLFVNNMELMHYSYERYLENQLRKSFGFEGTPIRFLIREKEKE